MSATRYRKSYLLGALLAFGCSTPSVPVPPPEVDISALSFTAPTTGQLVMTGTPSVAHDNAQFFITDRDNGDGVIITAAADGTFTTPVFNAAVGDSIKVQYTTPLLVLSKPTCVTVVLAGPLTGDLCK